MAVVKGCMGMLRCIILSLSLSLMEIASLRMHCIPLPLMEEQDKMPIFFLMEKMLQVLGCFIDPISELHGTTCA